MEKRKRKNIYESYPIEHWKTYVFQEIKRKEKKLMDHHKAFVMGLVIILFVVVGGGVIGFTVKNEGVAVPLAMLVGTSAITFLFSLF